MTIQYFPQAPGAAPNDHRHGFESFTHAANAIGHMADSTGVATTSSPSSVRYWPKLAEDTPTNRAELARRIVQMFGENFDRGAFTGDIRVTWAKRWLDEQRAEAAIAGEVDRAMGAK